MKQKEKPNLGALRDNHFYKENDEIEQIPLAEPKMSFKDEEIFEPEENETGESYVTLSNSAVGDKEVSKDFMGSIGSWINDLFNGFNDKPKVTVPAKRPCTPPQVVKKMKSSEVEKINSEYIKSLNVLKEEMKKKLKRETTVHLSSKDKFFKLNFDKQTDKKLKKQWTPTVESDTINNYKKDPNAFVHKFPIKINEKEIIYVTAQPENQAGLNKSTLSKGKPSKNERSKNGEIEYYFTTPSDLSRNLLLNINDQENFPQLYKNAHLGVQEPPPYKPRNSRCYTTNANLVGNSSGNSLVPVSKKSKRSAFQASDPTITISAEECLSPKKNALKLKKKQTFELTGDVSDFDKIKSRKILNSSPESSKIETKPTSEQLVKQLIKKTKVTSHTQAFKKKPKSTTTETTPKSRFLQSATTSLVANVLAKKENNLLLLKTASKPSGEIKIFKPDRTLKDWSECQKLSELKLREVRFDVNRIIPARLNKSSYLSDVDNKPDAQSNSPRSARRLSETGTSWSYRDAKEQSGKMKKDIKHIISRIDHRYDTLQAKDKYNKIEQENEELKAQNARHQKDHELFRSNPTGIQQIESSDANGEVECKTDGSVFSENASGSTDVIVLHTDIQPVFEKSEKNEKYRIALPEKTQTSLNVNFENANSEGAEKECGNEIVPLFKSESSKLQQYKNKLVKTKSLQYIKEDDVRTLTKSLPDVEEKSQSKKQISKTSERQLLPTEIRPAKSLEPVLLNRLYSTNVTTESNQKSLKVIPFTQPKSLSFTNDVIRDCEKKDKEQDKKRDKGIKETGGKTPNDSCGFEQPKKPGPNCDKSANS